MALSNHDRINRSTFDKAFSPETNRRVRAINPVGMQGALSPHWIVKVIASPFCIHTENVGNE